MPDECIDCGSENLKYHTALGGTESTPPEPAGWECLDCGAWMDDEYDEATRLGI